MFRLMNHITLLFPVSELCGDALTSHLAAPSTCSDFSIRVLGESLPLAAWACLQNLMDAPGAGSQL